MPGRILIIDDVATNRIVLKARLAAAAYQVELSAGAQDALRLGRAQLPNLVLIGGSMPTNTALDLCRALRALPGAATLPIVLLGDTSDRAIRLSALEAGVDAFLDPLPPVGVMLARIRNLLRRDAAEKDLMRHQADAGAFGFAEAAGGFASPGQIALIAPSVAIGMHWRNALRPLLRDRIEVMDPTHALSELNNTRHPDAILIAPDADASGAALGLLSDLRCRNETHRAAILMLMDHVDPMLGIMALDLGVTDLVETGFDAVEMALRLRRELARKTLGDRCRNALQDGLRLASIDPLTGLHNRRFAMSELERIVTKSVQTNSDFAVMMLDLDRFKRINDTYGHAAGDTVLAEVSRRMGACLRDGDLLARIGGEEFLAVTRQCSASDAAYTAERLRKAVSVTPVRLKDGQEISVTLSIGLVLGGPRGLQNECDPARLIDIADKALYSAKADGRNQITVHRTAA